MIFVEFGKNVIGMNIVDSISVMLIMVFEILFMVFCVVFLGGRFLCVMMCLMFLMIMMVLLIRMLMVSIMVNMVSMLIEKFVSSMMVSVFDSVIGMISVGIIVYWKFCRNRNIMIKISIMVLIRVWIIFLMDLLMKGVVL